MVFYHHDEIDFSKAVDGKAQHRKIDRNIEALGFFYK